MHILVASPTLWARKDLILKVTASVMNGSYRPVSLYYESSGGGWVKNANRIIAQSDTDAVLFGSDDQEFYPDAISVAVEALKERFPDTDGMVGIRQEHGGTEYGVRLLGRKFIERFPTKEVECPDYINYFSDQELWEYTKSLNRFHFCENAVVKHHMPKDTTRNAMWATWDRDEYTWRKRQERKLLWGREFDLLNK